MKNLLFVFIFILLVSLLHSTIRNVPSPYTTIQAGIDAAVNGDVVLVQPGTYVENINFNGKLITVGSLHYTTADTSYISTTIIDGNNSGSVVSFQMGEDPTAVLTGFTITNGLGSFAWPEYIAGGITCRNSSSPSLENLIITGNSNNDYGGGIVCYDYSNPSIENVTISDNNANLGGGICCVHYSSPNLQNVVLSGNVSTGNGGGIYCENFSNITLQNVTISNNSASYGGGIYCNNSSPSLTIVTISDNTTSDDGGGIYCYNQSNLSLESVTIIDNTASNNAAGIYCYQSNLDLVHVTITGNVAFNLFDEIYCSASNLEMLNSIIWGDGQFEIWIPTSTSTTSYSDITGGWPGIGNIDAYPLFIDPYSVDCHLTWSNFPVPDATMSPCINTGDPDSPLDPDASTADMGAYYFDTSTAAPSISAITDASDDQGRYVQLIWNRSPYDPVLIGSYSIWRYDDVLGDRDFHEIYSNPAEICDKAEEDSSKQYYWQRDNEILAFITQLPAMGFSQYSIIAPTLKDSSFVSINYSTFKVFAHTDITQMYFSSQPDSGYSVDNIAPDEAEALITMDGSILNISWDEVEYGSFQGNSYPEINGIWYKIYAGDSPDFVCDEAHLIDTVTNLNYDYPIGGENKKFFKVVVSDQP